MKYTLQKKKEKKTVNNLNNKEEKYQIVRVVSRPLMENCYLIIDVETKKTLIIDPGKEFDKIVEAIDKNNAIPVAIAITHAHYDHIESVDLVREKYNIPVYIHDIEKDYLGDIEKNLSFRHEPNFVVIKNADKIFTQTGRVDIEGFSCRIELIPGHSLGSIVYIFDNFAIVGDTLFKGGCGRTDLPFSTSHSELISGIRKYLITLPKETKIYPGHGFSTTVEYEILTNPYLNGVTR